MNAAVLAGAVEAKRRLARSLTVAARAAMAACALFLTSCTAVQWLNPVIAEGRAVFEDGLAGIWQGTDSERIVFSRAVGHDVGYQVVYLDKNGDATVFEGTLAKTGGVLLMDVTPKEAGVLQVATHGLVRIWLDGDQLRWAFADSDWMKDRIAKRGLPAQDMADTRLVIAPTEAINGQVLAAAADDRAYREIHETRRLR